VTGLATLSAATVGGGGLGVSGPTTLASATLSGTLGVTGLATLAAATVGGLTVSGHIIATVTVPVVFSFSFADPDITAIMVAGSRDVAGRISIKGTPGPGSESIAGGDTVSVVFGTAFASPPVVVLSPGTNGTGWGFCQWTVSSVTGFGFTARAQNASGNIELNPVELNWICIGVS
jgi:hypothetical protein